MAVTGKLVSGTCEQFTKARREQTGAHRGDELSESTGRDDEDPPAEGHEDEPADDDDMRGTIGAKINDIRKRRATARSDGILGDAVRAHELTVDIAEHGSPADVAELVADLGADDTTSDLARLALDRAAAGQRIKELSQLIAKITAHSPPDEPDRMLQSVIQRRTPFDIAELLSMLPDDTQQALIGKLNGSSTPNDCRASVSLWLRDHGHDALATQVTRQFSRNLDHNLLADLVRGLFAQADEISAIQAINTAIDPVSGSLGKAAALASNLHDVSPPLGERVIEMALDQLEPSDKLVLASELRRGEWEEDAATRIWDAVVPQIDAGPLVEALERFPGDAKRPLRKAAETHSVDRVAALAIEVHGRIPGGEITVLKTVAEKRPVSEIFTMARHLTDFGYGQMAWTLLTDAANRIHERRDGEEVGDFIDRLLDDEDGKPTAKQRRQLTKTLLENVAGNRDPVQLMDMVARLMRRERSQRQYYELHEDVEAAVAKHFTGSELSRLPLVKGSRYRPAVLEIEKKALEIPREEVAVEQFPGIIKALKTVGTPGDDLTALLIHVGWKNSLNALNILGNLRAQDMGPEADCVSTGYSLAQRMKHPGKEPRFFPPDEHPSDTDSDS